MVDKVVRIPLELIRAVREKDESLNEVENDAEVVRAALRLFVKSEGRGDE